MNVGDRVRLLTGTEEGIVTRLLDSELVEVAIDNDFTIPVLRREVVVVAQEEGNNFDRTAPDFRVGQVPGKNANASKKDRSQRPTQSAAPKPAQPSLQEALAAVASSGAGVAKVSGPAAGSAKQAAAAKGLFLALVHQSPELLGVTLINNTEADVLYTYGEETSARPYRALAADKLGPKSSTKPLSFLHMKDFETWPAVIFQLLPHRLNGDAAYEPAHQATGVQGQHLLLEQPPRARHRQGRLPVSARRESRRGHCPRETNSGSPDARTGRAHQARRRRHCGPESPAQRRCSGQASGCSGRGHTGSHGARGGPAPRVRPAPGSPAARQQRRAVEHGHSAPPGSMPLRMR
ncbi:hypothetical protein ACFQT0_18755 [Hymenobacter humi]|uniref:DUF2027 domain-containing protein n=1 Tax=Hymenobacter humi TaxID=1411620 RepID=A0ABW2U6Q8_9BACT